MTNRREDTKWLLRPSVSTLDSEDGCCEVDPVINNQDDDEEDYGLRKLAETHPPGVRVAKSDLTIPCTEIPAPRLLRESGFVDVTYTYALKQIIVLTYPTERPHDPDTSNGPPPSRLDTVTTRVRDSRSGGSSYRSTASRKWLGILPRAPSPPRVSSVASGVANTAEASSSGSNRHRTSHENSRDLSSCSGSSNRDSATASTYHSLSPMEHQPLTMPDIEEDSMRHRYSLDPKSHFALALCSCLFCCLLLGMVALFKSRQVHRYTECGDIRSAHQASRQSRHWSTAAICLGLLVWLSVAVAVVFVLHRYSIM